MWKRLTGAGLGLAVALAAAGSPAGRRAAAPVVADITLPSDGDTIEGHVPAHATLVGLLQQQHVAADLAVSLADAVRGVFNPRSCAPTRRTG